MITLLLLAATLLGLLAFFEPCTIATHTLFSVRANQASDKSCCQSLLTVWLSRTVLLVAIFYSLFYSLIRQNGDHTHPVLY